jgi:hypothetical protein
MTDSHANNNKTNRQRMAKRGNAYIGDSRERGSHDTDARTTHKPISDEPARHRSMHPRTVTCTHAQVTAVHHINAITIAHTRSPLLSTHIRTRHRPRSQLHQSSRHHRTSWRRHATTHSTLKHVPVDAVVIAPSPTRTTGRSSPSHSHAARQTLAAAHDHAGRRHRHRSCMRRSCFRKFDESAAR